MEKITIYGNLGGDPETKSNERTGNEFFQVSVACSRKKLNTISEYHTTWYRVTFSQKSLLPYLKKGTKVLVHGAFRIDEWKDRNGEKQYTLVVNADYIQLMGNETPRTETTPQAAPASQAEQAPPRPGPTVVLPTRPATSNLPSTPNLNFEPNPGDDDLPF